MGRPSDFTAGAGPWDEAMFGSKIYQVSVFFGGSLK